MNYVVFIYEAFGSDTDYKVIAINNINDKEKVMNELVKNWPDKDFGDDGEWCYDTEQLPNPYNQHNIDQALRTIRQRHTPN